MSCSKHGRPLFRRFLASFALALSIAVLAAGCEEETTQPEDDSLVLPEPSTPEALISAIELIYNDRTHGADERLAAYASLLDSNFRFHFAMNDFGWPLAPSWGLEKELSAHANMFASTGDVRLYDTGEGELALIGQPEVGGSLHVAARRPGARQVLFLLGEAAVAPSTMVNMQGDFLLRRGSGLTSHARAANSSGRADLILNLDGNPMQIGQHLAIQAAFRLQSGWVLSERLLVPVIL